MGLTQQEYVSLVKDLNHHNYLYHVLDQAEISDAEFDQRFRQLKETEEEHPDWVLSDSPTQTVGGISGRMKLKHPIRMYSLENIFNDSDLLKYWKRFSQLRHKAGSSVDQYWCDYKMDGLALDLIYRQGKLSVAITRGNGLVGDDVYVNAMTIPNIPKHIPTKLLTCIRGEVVVHRSDFFAVLRDLEKQGLPGFSNMRNYASGSLKQKDPAVTATRMLKFYAWELLVLEKPPMYRDEQAAYLVKLGFNVPGGKICSTKEDIISFINETARIRNTLPYGIDGVVIKQNDPAYDKIIGWNSHAPLWAVAWKFAADGADTTIESINWKVGHSGKLTPVAKLKPVTIDGVTISAVTMYNAQYVMDHQLGEQAKVRIIRSGDVIPKITEIVSNGKYAGIPKVCPNCGQPVSMEGKELFCTNPECKGIFKSFMNYLVGKEGLDIKGIGSAMVGSIVDSSTATKFIDLFSPLEAKDPSINQDVLDKLVLRVRNVNMRELLMILGIPSMGRAIAGKITAEVENLKGLKHLLTDEKTFRLLPVNDSVKENMRIWYSSEYNKKLLDQLLELKLPYCD